MSKQEGGKRKNRDKRIIFVTAFGVWDVGHVERKAAFGNCTEVVEWLVQETPYLDSRAASPRPPPPVVFLMQNNPYPPGAGNDNFLKNLHQVQREVVESKREKSHAEVYLVDNRDSLYENMLCYRRSPKEIHFVEPVKLIEGKMLWDLIALVGDDGN